MGLLDGVLGILKSSGMEDQAIAMIAAKVGLDPAMAQNIAGSLLNNIQNGQSPEAAAQAAADEHGVDPATVSQLGDALAGHAGAEGGLGGLAGMAGSLLGAAGGAGGMAGMLGGLLGGKKD